MYHKPLATGGVLIRRVMRLAKTRGLSLPLQGRVTVAVSGGSDSMALAHLMHKYGRRWVAPEQLSWVHIDHGWRESSAKDAEWVCEQARARGIPCTVHKLDLMTRKPRQSWEEHASRARTQVFASLQREGSWVLTAHHLEDLAETLLWRFLTHAPAHLHVEGIEYRRDKLVRPLLSVHKAELQAFLREENVPWREDSTNADPRFLRNRMRQTLMPEIYALFPAFVSRKKMPRSD